MLRHLHAIIRKLSAACSAFLALQAVGITLHPLTSLKLYKTLCLPLLLHGSELWCITKSKLLMLERMHSRILQGLLAQCSSSVVTVLVGMSVIVDLIQQWQLSFTVSTRHLLEDSIARHVLCMYAKASGMKDLVSTYTE